MGGNHEHLIPFRLELNNSWPISLHRIISGESDPSLPRPAHLQCGFVAQIRQSLGKRTCIGKLEHSTIFSIILCYGSHGKYIGVLHHTSVTRVLYLY